MFIGAIMQPFGCMSSEKTKILRLYTIVDAEPLSSELVPGEPLFVANSGKIYDGVLLPARVNFHVIRALVRKSYPT
jgi:hypothetical protein